MRLNYGSSGPCGSGEEDFLCFSHDAPGAWPVWTLGAWLAGFTMRITIHCYTQNRKSYVPCGFGEDFLCFSHCKSMEANDPRVGAIFDPRDMVGRIYKEDHYTCYTQNMKALGHVVLEKIFYVCHGNHSSDPTWLKTSKLGFLPYMGMVAILVM